MREGYKKTELGEIPVDWGVKLLQEISIGNCKYGINATAKEYREGDARYLRITDIGENYNILNTDIKSIDADDEEIKNYILKENDIVFARTGNTTGKSYLYDEKDGLLVFAGYLIKFTINNQKYEPMFLKYYVQTKSYWNWVKKMSLRSGQPGINSKEYSSLLVPSPPLGEQKKIADILSTVDKQIEQTDKLIEKTKKLKKGLMQKLLTRGIGHTKFKKTELGEIPAEWEVKKFGDIIKLEYGYNLAANQRVAGQFPVIGSQGIVGYHNEKFVDGPGIVIGRKGSIDKVTFIEKGFCPIDTTYYVNNINGYDWKWLFYLISLQNIKRLNAATGVPSLNRNDFYTLIGPIPPIKEQNKISSILSDVDKKIQQYLIKANKLNLLKKALMQKLLTGKIRVKVS